MRLGLVRVAALVLPLILPAAAARADTGVMAPGAAAVTAFSGVPATKSDQPFDLDGPSLRVLSLPGGDFGLSDSDVRYTATASEIGQVFGVTLDTELQPNIYVAATSAYGLAIFTADGRVNRGGDGATYAPGQFGPADQGGGPNSIWRIDGRTGQVSLFANVETNGVTPQPASLGGLAFDPATHQLFAADRATGLIHRYTMDGAEQQTYDHGVDGRSAAGLPPEPFDPAGLADITRHDFRTTSPDSWGMAPPERRVFALAIHSGRLYYSVADGPSIWSIGIARDGAFAGDPRFETKLGALHRGIEITSIAFDNRGWMYTAERGATTGDTDFVAVADDGNARVKRFFAPKPPGDPTPGLWIQPGQDYAIGMPPQYRNADGGTALTCGRILWSTGERLLDDPSAEPDTYAHIDGLQGNDVSLVEPLNTPPEKSWFVNYYDDQADPASRGHMGAIAIWNVCGGNALPPPPPRIHYDCPRETFWLRGECRMPPQCPPGAYFRRGFCFYQHCPWGWLRDGNRCMRPPLHCRWNETYLRDRGGHDRCVPVGCPDYLRGNRDGYCGCPDNGIYRDGKCVRRPPCDPWLFRATNGTCRRCPDGSLPRQGTCVRRPPCDPVIFRLTNGTCRRCPDGSLPRNGQCRLPCNPNTLRAANVPCRCPDGSLPRDGTCVHRPPCNPNVLGIANIPCKCPDGSLPQNGSCNHKPPCNNNATLVLPGCEKPHHTGPVLHLPRLPHRGRDNGGNHDNGGNDNNGGNDEHGGGRHPHTGKSGGDNSGDNSGHGHDRVPLHPSHDSKGGGDTGGRHDKPVLHPLGGVLHILGGRHTDTGGDNNKGHRSRNGDRKPNEP